MSAKTGDGLESLADTLKEKSKIKETQKIQQKLFILGSINSGKSSLINALIEHTNYKKK